MGSCPSLGHCAFSAPTRTLRNSGPAASSAYWRAQLPGAPILATTRLVDLAAAERLVAAGTADLVGMTRALLADPELIAKTVGDHIEVTTPGGSKAYEILKIEFR